MKILRLNTYNYTLCQHKRTNNYSDNKNLSIRTNNNFFNFPTAYYQINFSGYNNPEQKALKNLADVICPSCGNKMKTVEERRTCTNDICNPENNNLLKTLTCKLNEGFFPHPQQNEIINNMIKVLKLFSAIHSSTRTNSLRKLLNNNQNLPDYLKNKKIPFTEEENEQIINVLGDDIQKIKEKMPYRLNIRETLLLTKEIFYPTNNIINKNNTFLNKISEDISNKLATETIPFYDSSKIRELIIKNLEHIQKKIEDIKKMSPVAFKNNEPTNAQKRAMMNVFNFCLIKIQESKASKKEKRKVMEAIKLYKNITREEMPEFINEPSAFMHFITDTNNESFIKLAIILLIEQIGSSIDHTNPICESLDDSLENNGLLCSHCNIAKDDQKEIPLTFLTEHVESLINSYKKHQKEFEKTYIKTYITIFLKKLMEEKIFSNEKCISYLQNLKN